MKIKIEHNKSLPSYIDITGLCGKVLSYTHISVKIAPIHCKIDCGGLCTECMTSALETMYENTSKV